jgi:hypothetical protein
MNIDYSEIQFEISAETCACDISESKKMKIAYLWQENYHSLCLDKKEILLREILACERLLKYAPNATEKKIIEKEITDLKLMLDLLT